MPFARLTLFLSHLKLNCEKVLFCFFWAWAGHGHGARMQVRTPILHVYKYYLTGITVIEQDDQKGIPKRIL